MNAWGWHEVHRRLEAATTVWTVISYHCSDPTLCVRLFPQFVVTSQYHLLGNLF